MVPQLMASYELQHRAEEYSEEPPLLLQILLSSPQTVDDEGPIERAERMYRLLL